MNGANPVEADQVRHTSDKNEALDDKERSSSMDKAHGRAVTATKTPAARASNYPSRGGRHTTGPGARTVVRGRHHDLLARDAAAGAATARPTGSRTSRPHPGW